MSLFNTCIHVCPSALYFKGASIAVRSLAQYTYPLRTMSRAMCQLCMRLAGR